MIKRIACVVLTIVTVFVSCYFENGYTAFAASDNTDDSCYKWTLCTEETKFQEALLSASKEEGITSEGTTFSTFVTDGKSKSYDAQAKDDTGYAKVMFVAEYTDNDGNKQYAYLKGFSYNEEIDIYKDKQVLAMSMVPTSSVDGISPGAGVFYTKTDPGVPWVKTMYKGTEKDIDQHFDTGNWQGHQYAIREGDGGNKPGARFLTTFDSIYACQNGYVTIYDAEWAKDGKTYFVGNGLTFFGKSINRNEVHFDQEYHTICFNNNNVGKSEFVTSADGKAYIKAFSNYEFFSDGVTLDAVNSTYTRPYVSYERNWSVIYYNGTPTVYSSYYFPDKTQYEIGYNLNKLRKSYGQNSKRSRLYSWPSNFTEADVDKLYSSGIFKSTDNSKTIYYQFMRIFEAIRYRWLLTNVYDEYCGNAAEMGTDYKKTSTMSSFYVYVGEKSTYSSLKEQYTGDYEWTWCKTQSQFQNALLEASIAEGLTAEGTTLNDLRKKGTFGNLETDDTTYATDEGYARVMFITEYTDSSGGKEYVYMTGYNNNKEIVVSNDKETIALKMRKTSIISGCNPGSDVFYTQSNAEVPWVKAIYSNGTTEDTGIWVGSQYSIRGHNNQTDSPDKACLITLDNIFSAGNGGRVINSKGEFRMVGNGFSLSERDVNGNNGAYLAENYHTICFNNNGSLSNSLITCGDGKAVVKTFQTNKKFVADTNNKKNVQLGDIEKLTDEPFVAYQRNWSVVDYQGEPVMYSSVYFDDYDQFRLADAFALLRYSQNFNPTYESNNKDGLLDKLFNLSSSFSYSDGREKAINHFGINIKNNKNWYCFDERPGNVASMGTDINTGSTMSAFYVYVGKRVDSSAGGKKITSGKTLSLTSSETIPSGTLITVEKGGTLIIDGIVPCYGNIVLNGGTLIVKGQLLNTYPAGYGVPKKDDEYTKTNSISITGSNATVIVLADAYVNMELINSYIELNNSSLFVYGMMCCVGKLTIKNSYVNVGSDGILVHRCTLNENFDYKIFCNGGLRQMKKSPDAKNKYYTSFFNAISTNFYSAASFANSSVNNRGSILLCTKINKDTKLSDELNYSF